MSRKSLIAAIVALFVVVLPLWVLGRKTQTRPVLTVVAGDLDLGNQWIQSKLFHSITVLNPSKSRVVVRNVGASCNCTSVEPRSFRLNPGETRELNLVIDLQPPLSLLPLTKPTRFKVVIDFLVEDGTRTSPIELSAQVRSPFVFRPGSVDFGRRLLKDVEAVESFVVECIAPIESMDVSSDVDGVDLRLERLDEALFRVDAFISSARSPGPLTGLVKVTGKTSSDGVSLSHRLRMDGEVIREVSVEPPHVAFGILPLGQAAKQQVALRSRIGGSIEIVAVELDSEGSNAEATEVAGCPVVTIRQAALARGNQKGVVNLIYRMSALGGKEVRTTIPVTYFGASTP
jgi:hypothetical protein